jgi:hypothetical protein
MFSPFSSKEFKVDLAASDTQVLGRLSQQAGQAYP